MANEPAGTPGEDLDDSPLGRAEVDVGPLAGGVPAGEVHGELAGVHRERRLVVTLASAGCAHAGNELLDVERLGHEVLRAPIEGVDLVLRAGLAREDDDGELARLCRLVRTSSPSTSGRPRSSSTRSAATSSTASRAPRPVATVCTSNPRARKATASVRLIAGSSSTTKIDVTRLRAGAADAPPGRSSTNVRPPPGVSSVAIVPPMASVKPFARPDPSRRRPAAGRHRAAERREQALAVAVGTPGPLSAIRRVTRSLSRRRRCGSRRRAACTSARSRRCWPARGPADLDRPDGEVGIDSHLDPVAAVDRLQALRGARQVDVRDRGRH